MDTMRKEQGTVARAAEERQVLRLRSEAAFCAYCQGRSAPRRTLARADEPGRLTVCARCLRSLPHRKADVSQARNRTALASFAEENGLVVWQVGVVGYALPPIGS
ncbi:MAG: hypothetical protein LC620_04750 [Halobacteriales archaeon]|nr:hypothetical protein [Halobacteriales archaeon]